MTTLKDIVNLADTHRHCLSCSEPRCPVSVTETRHRILTVADED